MTLLRQGAPAAVTYVSLWGYEQEVAPAWRPLCTGACSLRMAPGGYYLALAKRNRDPIVLSEPVAITGPSSLRADYVDRHGLRVAGIAIAIAGGASGLAMAFAASAQGETVCNAFGDCFTEGGNGALFAAGLVTVVGSIILGSVFMMQSDRARIAVTPLSTGATREGGRAEGPRFACGSETSAGVDFPRRATTVCAHFVRCRRACPLSVVDDSEPPASGPGLLQT